jgi:putative molybdopterin biosynthesis protein
MNIELTLNWQITQSDQQNIDPVLFPLLTAIQHLGSLRRATDEVKVSYRFAWGLLAKWEQLLGQPLVILERGRGANLSPTGEKLLHANVQLLARFTPELNNFATQFKQDFVSLLDKGIKPSLNIFASHGLAISALRDLINQQSNFKLDLHFHGSLESLRALHNGHCDIAGFHIPIGPLANNLRVQYLDLINSLEYQLIYVVKRNQGLMFKAENATKISAISSLTNKDLRFINRQTDSGTRLLFDQLLEGQSIKPHEINGYDHEEFTHMAVAAMIASGAADVGFGIAPMATKFNLEFIPLVWEHYCLAIPTSLSNDESAKQITELLQSSQFRDSLSEFSGYDASRSGYSVNFKDIFF